MKQETTKDSPQGAHVPPPQGPLLPGVKQVLLTFSEGRMRPACEYAGQSVDTYSEVVQLPFLPKGLIIWGATADTFIHQVKVGNVTELEIGGYQPIPARYFDSGRSFEELERLADVGELELAVEQRQLFEMREAPVGTAITVSVSGPYDRFCLWGLTYSDFGRAYRRAVVERLDSGVYSGRLDEVGLAGPRTVFDVTAPDAASAAALLGSLLSQSRGY